MSSRFFIKQITASGEKVEFSELTFQDGVNIIHGASNTGKSYAVACIDFMFGGEPPFSKYDTGYDTVAMRMESHDGDFVYMERKIVDGKNGEIGANTVKVISPFEDIEDGDLNISKGEYNDLLLRLMGIKERHMIIATEEFKTQSLTLRSMWHFFFISEDNIFGKKTTFDAPKFNRINASLMSLLFLLTGNDYKELIPAETKAERELKAAQKTGVIIYLNQKIQELKERRDQMESALAETPDVDIDGKIEDILKEIEEVDAQIADANARSRLLLKQIYDVSGKLEEARFLQDRYKALKTQYTSDIKRLRFITDGERKKAATPQIVRCPFCDSEMQDKAPKKISYIAASTAELDRITLQLQDLEGAEKDIQSEITALEAQIKRLNQENESVTGLVNRKLKPRMSELRQTVDSYRRVTVLRQDLYALGNMAEELNTDATTQSMTVEDEENSKFSARKVFNEKMWKAMSDQFADMVRDCAYPHFMVARIDLDTCDAVVNGKYKKSEGKGYRAFLNTIMLFNLMKYLSAVGQYTPHLLVLDSPILSLKEKKKKITEKEKATPGMRESLFRYVINNCGENQVIIAENELPENVDYTGAKLIEFTLDENDGRYGFLKSVRNDTEEEA